MLVDVLTLLCIVSIAQKRQPQKELRLPMPAVVLPTTKWTGTLTASLASHRALKSQLHSEVVSNELPTWPLTR